MDEAKKKPAFLSWCLLFIVLSVFVSPISAHAANGMVVDGTPGTTMGSNLGSSNLSTTITTTLSNDILIAYVGWESGGLSTANSQSSSVTSSTGAPSLTWTLRTRYQNGGDQTQEIWWAVAPTPGTYGVKINWSGQSIDDVSLILFAVNGANTISPWEGASATKLPLGTVSGNYSTAYANDFVLTFYANEKATQATGPLPSGVNTSIANVLNGGAIWWEYLFVAGAAVSSTITNQIWGWSGTTGQTGTYSAVIIDALRDANYVEVNSVTFSVNLAATYKSTAIIQATIPSSAGRVTFFAKGKPIPGCKSRKTSGSNSISCNWKPATHGQIPVYVSYISDGGQQFISAASNVNVSARQTTR